MAFIGNYVLPKSIDLGSESGLAQSILIDAAVLAAFAVQHSVMARSAFKAVEYAMAVRISAAVQRLQGSVVYAESCLSTIGPITLEVNQTGERSAGNPHAAFDEALVDNDRSGIL